MTREHDSQSGESCRSTAKLHIAFSVTRRLFSYTLPSPTSLHLLMEVSAERTGRDVIFLFELKDILSVLDVQASKGKPNVI
jgi:hypothetical protein